MLGNNVRVLATAGFEQSALTIDHGQYDFDPFGQSVQGLAFLVTDAKFPHNSS